MTAAVRPKPKTTSKAARKATSGASATSTLPGRPFPLATVTQLELIELLHKASIIEIIVPEVEPGRYQVHAVVVWRFGRSVLTGSSGQPRTFRSLDTLRLHLKTVGIGSTLVRLELLP